MKTITTHDSLLAICLYAAFSNGQQSDEERSQISRYLPEIQQRAKTLDTAAILSMVRGGGPV